MLDRSAVGQLSSFISSRTKWQRCALNRCRFVLLDKDEICPTADLSNIGQPNGPAYSTDELLNTPKIGPLKNGNRKSCAVSNRGISDDLK